MIGRGGVARRPRRGRLRSAVLMLLASCASPARVTAPDTTSPGASSHHDLRPGAFVAGRSYVWKLEGNLESRQLAGVLVVDVDAGGRLHVSSQDLPLRADDARELVDSVLPPHEPAERRWTIPGLGSTYASESPDTERVDRTTRVGPAEVRIVREGKLVSKRYLGSEQGEATARIDPAVPRYAAIAWTFESESTSSVGAAPSTRAHAQMALKLEFDREASADREREREKLARSAAAARANYAAYVGSHDAAREIADARAVLIRAPASGSPYHVSFEAVSARHVLTFYARRDTDAVARALLAMPDDARAPFLRALRVGCRSKDVELLSALRAGLPSLDVRMAFASCANERVRADLVALARGHDDIAADAKKTLQSLDRARDPAGAIRSALRDALVTIGTEVLAVSSEPQRAVPAIIEWLDREPAIAAQWLEAITRQPFGTDADQWRAYWRDHKGKSFDAWLEEASRGAVPAMRLSAYQTMGLRAPTESAKSALAEGLLDRRTRMTAALSLASLGDGRGVPVLLDALESDAPADRASALVGLAPLMPTTMGFGVNGLESERVEALARIREWAARAGWIAR